jgi:hypothetical protein
VEFARGLSALGIEILSTGGTAKSLLEAGIVVVPVEFYRLPEMLDGRVKTFSENPRTISDDHPPANVTIRTQAIDLVVVNLYPDRGTKPDCTFTRRYRKYRHQSLRCCARQKITPMLGGDRPRISSGLALGAGACREQSGLAKKAFNSACYDAAIPIIWAT